jgi:hypothetical protein
MTEQILPIPEAHTGGTKRTANRVLQVTDSRPGICLSVI